MSAEFFQDILVIKNAFSADLCRLLVAEFDKNIEKFIENNRNGKKIVVGFGYRENFDLVKGFDLLYQKVFSDLADHGVLVKAYEYPSMVKMFNGGYVEDHYDTYVLKGDEDKIGSRVQNRDLSIVVYLNDDFDGGAIRFPNQNYAYKPEIGSVVAFPSTPDYLHAVEKIENGDRYTLNSWAKTNDVNMVPYMNLQDVYPFEIKR